MATALQTRVQERLASDPGFNLKILAGHTPFAHATIRNWMAGCNRENPRLKQEVARVMDLVDRGEISLQAGAPSGAVSIEEIRRPAPRKLHRSAGRFYEIKTARDIADGLDYCLETGCIAVITADYGCGKTAAAEWWKRTTGKDENVVLFEFDVFTVSSKCELIAELGRRLGLKVHGGMTCGARDFAAVVEYLREEPHLLIFDQCEAVSMRVFQAIRQLWDRTRDAGVGVALLGAPILRTRMLASRSQDLGALTSRVGCWVPAGGVTRDEMAAIVKGEGITDVDDKAFDLWWQCVRGSMRYLLESLDMLKARHEGRRVQEKTIIGIAGRLWGLQVKEARP